MKLLNLLFVMFLAGDFGQRKRFLGFHANEHIKTFFVDNESKMAGNDINQDNIQGCLKDKTFCLWERLFYVPSTSVVEDNWFAQYKSQCLIGSKKISPNRQNFLSFRHPRKMTGTSKSKLRFGIARAEDECYWIFKPSPTLLFVEIAWFWTWTLADLHFWIKVCIWFSTRAINLKSVL